MTTDDKGKRQGPIWRALRNAGWLLGGKGVGALFSLVYLGIAARALGVAGFGDFALVLAYGQAVSNVVGFQSWQTVIRYGAIHLAANRPDRLRRIILFAAALDLVAAAMGAVLAVVGVLIVGPLLDWTPQVQWLAALFGLSLLFGVRGAPTGVLRLFDRFDIAAYSETVLPAVRLIGALVAGVMGATIAGFLAAWAIAELVTTAAMWVATRREMTRRGLYDTAGPRFRGVVAENPELWRFSWTTNLASSINLMWQQLPTLVVGWHAGPAAAGGYRIASQLSAALSKPIVSLTRSIYPELAKLALDGGIRGLLPVVRRSTGLAAIAALITVAFIAVAGEPLLTLVVGPQYRFAYPFLLLLTIAAAINLIGFALEPTLVALGRPGLALAARTSAGLIYMLLMVLLLHKLGPVGAAYAAIAATLLSLIFLVGALRQAAQPSTIVV